MLHHWGANYFGESAMAGQQTTADATGRHGILRCACAACLFGLLACCAAHSSTPIAPSPVRPTADRYLCVFAASEETTAFAEKLRANGYVVGHKNCAIHLTVTVNVLGEDTGEQYLGAAIGTVEDEDIDVRVDLAGLPSPSTEVVATRLIRAFESSAELSALARKHAPSVVLDRHWRSDSESIANTKWNYCDVEAGITFAADGSLIMDHVGYPNPNCDKARWTQVRDHVWFDCDGELYDLRIHDEAMEGQWSRADPKGLAPAIEARKLKHLNDGFVCLVLLH
jgi:hypothetical protein